MSEKVTVTEDDVIEHIFKVLYSNLHKNEMHLENDILKPTNITFTHEQAEHLRELVVATGLIKGSIGFGKAGYVYLTGTGISIMKQYKSYHAYLHAVQGRQPQQFMAAHDDDFEQLNSSSNTQNTTNDNHHGDDMAH